MPKARLSRPRKAQLPRGFSDRVGAAWRREHQLVARLLPLYEAHGFVPLETPALEYSDLLGQFLPDAERPNQAVFSLQDDDEQWLSLRYDLTAPFARYVAMAYEGLPKPFRRYQYGSVWRNEKPGPGRLREFTQLDADIADSGEVAADAELCLLASEAMQRLDAPQHRVRINHRRLLDGVLAELGWDDSDPHYAARRLTILRAMDKLERLGADAVEALLGEGRADASGDVTAGAQLSPDQIAQVMAFLNLRDAPSHHAFLQKLDAHPLSNAPWQEGRAALADLAEIFAQSQGADALCFDCAIVRGLDYYTGCVFELEVGEGAHTMGAVGGGGRYDGLVARLKSAPVPATGFSLGITRLALVLDEPPQLASPPIFVAVLEKGAHARALALAQELRAAGFAAEAYVGSGGLKAQLRYADKRGMPWAILEGEDERQSGHVTLKDMQSGKAQSAEIASNQTWRQGTHAQERIKRSELVAALKKLQRTP